MNNQTLNNDQDNGGVDNKKALESAIRSIWQGLKDDYQTYCGIVCFTKKESDV